MALAPLKNPFPGQANTLNLNHRQQHRPMDNDFEIPMQVHVRVRGSWVSGFIIGMVAGVLNRTGMECNYQVEISGPDGRKQTGIYPRRDIRSLFD